MQLNSSVHTNNMGADSASSNGTWLIGSVGLLLRWPSSQWLLYTHTLCDWRKTMADLQIGYQHTTIMTCHLYIFQPAHPPPPALPHITPSHPDHDVMAHDIISFGTANLPIPVFATQWTFIKSDRITSGKGCTGTVLGHTQWVGKCKKANFWRVEEGVCVCGVEFSSFNLD